MKRVVGVYIGESNLVFMVSSVWYESLQVFTHSVSTLAWCSLLGHVMIMFLSSLLLSTFTFNKAQFYLVNTCYCLVWSLFRDL